MRGLASVAALLALLAAPARAAAPTEVFDAEGVVVVTSAAIQAATGAFPAQRLYYIRASTEVFSATTADGLALTEDAGVRLSSLTVPSIGIAVSSITGLSILPLNAGGFRMLYSVIGTTGAFNVYSATSADGLAWANDTGTALYGAQFPTMVKLNSGDWRVYFTSASQIWSALSTNEGRNWSSTSVVVAQTAGQVASTVLTSGKVRLYYTAPLTGNTSNTLLLSALSTDVNGSAFSLETGIRLSTSPGALSMPFVTATTESWRRRVYYDYLVGASTGDAYSATIDAPDPQSLSPSVVYNNKSPGQSTISGEVFSTASTAFLKQAGQANIAAAGLTRVSDQTMTATFNTQGATTGLWDLVVTNSNGLSTTLTNAVLIDFPGGSVTVTDNLLRPRNGTSLRADVTTFSAGRITAKLYTMDGKLVSTLYDQDAAAGTLTLTWNAKTSAGSTVSSGVYLLRITGPKLSSTDKVVVIK